MTEAQFEAYLNTLTDQQIGRTPIGELVRAAKAFNQVAGA